MSNMNKVAYNAIINNAKRSSTGRMNAVIPVDLVAVDSLYQRVEGRNERKLRKLLNEWDYNLMDAILVVAHPEEYMFYVVDGLGRLTVAREIGLEEIDAVIIFGPDDPEERRKFEAKYFLRQADCTDPIRPVLKHKALVLNGDPVAIAIEDLCKKYGVDIMSKSGKRKAKRLGSYASATDLIKAKGKSAMEFAFKVIAECGFQYDTNGYSAAIVEALGFIHDAYKNVSVSEISDFLRTMNPDTFKARSLNRYPERSGNSGKVAMVLFLQDYIVETYNTDRLYDDKGKRIS